jgi:hypothetical protein
MEYRVLITFLFWLKWELALCTVQTTFLKIVLWLWDTEVHRVEHKVTGIWFPRNKDHAFSIHEYHTQNIFLGGAGRAAILPKFRIIQETGSPILVSYWFSRLWRPMGTGDSFCLTGEATGTDLLSSISLLPVGWLSTRTAWHYILFITTAVRIWKPACETTRLNLFLIGLQNEGNDEYFLPNGSIW